MVVTNSERKETNVTTGFVQRSIQRMKLSSAFTGADNFRPMARDKRRCMMGFETDLRELAGRARLGSLRSASE